MKSFIFGLLAGLFILSGILYWQSKNSQTISYQYSNPTSNFTIKEKGLRAILKPKTVNPKVETGPALSVPILNYHYIRNNPNPDDQLGFNLSVTPENFAKQLDYIKNNGFQAITLDDLSNSLSSGINHLPKKPIILTFDDGYRDFYTVAFPELKSRNIKATAYIVLNFLNDKDGRYLTTSQLKELDHSGLITIGSHTLNHVDLPAIALTRASQEIYQSRRGLEKIVGHSVLHFCYPSGKWNETIANLVRAAGYQTATTTEIGSVHYQSDRYHLKRVRVSGGTDLAGFAEKLSPYYDPLYKQNSSVGNPTEEKKLTN